MLILPPSERILSVVTFWLAVTETLPPLVISPVAVTAPWLLTRLTAPFWAAML
ncbi:hypothetical protein [Gloeocapsopsis dulcis]|uniref:hypothetical protein n=1 Tax=Gloeocapsopsis dulcis TaxID=2859516 RepID=UPI00137B4B23